MYVTAPTPENLKTLFDFVCKGLDGLDYKVLLLSNVMDVAVIVCFIYRILLSSLMRLLFSTESVVLCILIVCTMSI